MENNMTTSHSECEIYEGCLKILQKTIDTVDEQLRQYDIMGDIQLNFVPTELVRTLFLSNTSHSGGTSTRKKCEELGIDTDDMIILQTYHDINWNDYIVIAGQDHYYWIYNENIGKYCKTRFRWKDMSEDEVKEEIEYEGFPIIWVSELPQ